jgi:hypothetical protein
MKDGAEKSENAKEKKGDKKKEDRVRQHKLASGSR